MKCPLCHADLRTAETCYNSSRGTNASRTNRRVMIRNAKSVFDWTPDFVMRLRICNACGVSYETIEVLLEDLRESYEERQK